MSINVYSATGRPDHGQESLPSDARLATQRRIAALLLGSVDADLAAAVFFVPLVLGGRIALGQLAAVILAVGVAACWCLRQALAPRAAWVRSSTEPLLLAALVLIGLQLVPWPPELLKTLSPRLHQILPLWTPAPDTPATLGVWSTSSLTPAATREALIVLAAFVLLFYTAVQRVQEIDDVERLIRWIAVATVLMAGFALVQYLTSNGKYFWFYQHPFAPADRSVQGSFTNRNHFAQFIALGMGPLIWWLYEGLRSSAREHRLAGQPFGHRSTWRDAQVGLRAVALGFTVFVGLMSLSRGGILAMLVAAIVCVLILHRGSLVGRKALLAVAGTAALAAACLLIFGYQRVAARLDDFRSLDRLDGEQEGRRKLWLAGLRAIADYPLTGTGLGSHGEVHQMYLSNVLTSQQIEYTHAENGYVQVGLEAGVPGLLLALTAVGLCVLWCLPARRRGMPGRAVLAYAAIVPGLAVNFLHSLVDFVWYVPGCMVVVVLLAACACRLWQGNRPGLTAPTPRWIPRMGWLAAAVYLLLVGGYMAQDRLRAVWAEPSWHRYTELAKRLDETDAGDRFSLLTSMIRELSQVVEWQPDHARAHARLASAHLALFDHADTSDICPLTAKQVREAALASQFESPEAVREWLSRAFGQRCGHLEAAARHALEAVSQCPLQGECYLCLADLSFLKGPRSPGVNAYIHQALRVRPFDGAVLFEAGREAMLAGDLEGAFAHWRASFQAGPLHRQRLLELLAGRVPVATLLDNFPFERATLGQMAAHYRRLGRREELQVVLARWAEAVEHEAHARPGAAAAGDWVEAARIHEEMGSLPECLRCLLSAVGCDASDFAARRGLGMCLYQLKQFPEAEEHLTWCLQRKPQDKALQSQVEAVLDARLRLGSRPTTGETINSRHQ